MKTFTDEVIRDRVDWYFNNRETIISNILRDKFIKSAKTLTEEKQPFARDFATVSLITEDLLRNVDISDRQKEYISEGIFSAYEYLIKYNSETCSNFKDFAKIVKNLNEIKFEDEINSKATTLGKATKTSILLKSSLKNINEEFDIVFLDVFEHELAHVISKQSKTIGLCRIMNIPLIRDNLYGMNKASFLDEIQTEYMSLKFLEENFEEIFKTKKFKFNLKDTSGKMEETLLQSDIFNYQDGVIIGEVINFLIPELKDTYLTNGSSLNKLLENNYPKMKEPITNVIKSFIEYTKNDNQEEISLSKENLMKLNGSLEELITAFDDNYGLSDEEYLKLTNAFLKNPIYVGGSTVSVNEISVTNLDIKRFGINLEEIDRSTIESILNSEADEIKYKDYYNLVDDLKSAREDLKEILEERKEIEVELAKTKTREKEYQSILRDKDTGYEFIL